MYCTPEWADALNEMLSDSVVNKCQDVDAVHKFLAQVAYETGYYSTVYQPADGGAGLIHMIPANWPVNVGDMDALWPGQDYGAALTRMGKRFFQTAQYGWKSVAAWFKHTNGVIPGCGVDLFEQDYETQTRCILSRVVDRQEAFDIVGRCLAEHSLGPSPSPAATPEPAAAPVSPTPAPVDSGEGWVQWSGAGITYHGPAYSVDRYCAANAQPIGDMCWRLASDTHFTQNVLPAFCARTDVHIAFGHPDSQACGECSEIRVKRRDGGYNYVTVMTTDHPAGTNTSPELSTDGKAWLDQDTVNGETCPQGGGPASADCALSDRLTFEYRSVPCVL